LLISVRLQDIFVRENADLHIGAGYDVTANELDYGSILAYRLLMNHTSSLHQHALQPFVTKWTHQANPSSRYSTLTVPDHWPNKSVKLVEGDFLDSFPQDGEFDAVVTLFFIDISENVVDFLSNIHRLLKPGGVWINLGRKLLFLSSSSTNTPPSCDPSTARLELTFIQH
jgi:SAM-dependent methyltransferase